MIAYVSIGVGAATLRRSIRDISARCCSVWFYRRERGFRGVNSAMLSMKVSTSMPEVEAALNRSIYWGSIQGLGSGFLFLVLVVASLITK